MRKLPLIALAALVVFDTSFAADKPKPSIPKRCIPKLVQHGKMCLNLSVSPGQKITDSPVVSFEVLESGEVAKVVLKRSSGVASLDRCAESWVRSMKYAQRPGCGMIESTMAVAVHF